MVHQRPGREVHPRSAAHPVMEAALHGALVLIGNLEVGMFDLCVCGIDACVYPVGHKAILAGWTVQQTRSNSPVHNGRREGRVRILNHDQPLLYFPSDGRRRVPP